MKRAATAIALTVLVVVPLVAVGGGAAVVDLELTGPEEVSSHEEVAFEAAVDAGSDVDIESYRLAFVDRRTNRTVNVTFAPDGSNVTFPEYATFEEGENVSTVGSEIDDRFARSELAHALSWDSGELWDTDMDERLGPEERPEAARVRTVALIGSASLVNTILAESNRPVYGIGTPPGIRVLALAETLRITPADGSPGSGYGYGYGDDGAGYGDDGAGYGDTGAGYGDDGAGYGDDGAGYGDGYGYDGDGDSPATLHIKFHTAAFIPDRTYDLQLHATTTDGETFESNVATFTVTNSSG